RAGERGGDTGGTGHAVDGGDQAGEVVLVGHDGGHGRAVERHAQRAGSADGGQHGAVGRSGSHADVGTCGVDRRRDRIGAGVCGVGDRAGRAGRRGDGEGGGGDRGGAAVGRCAAGGRGGVAGGRAAGRQ